MRHDVNCLLDVVPRTPPPNQQAAPTYCKQFCLPFIFYTEQFLSVPLPTRDQYKKQSFCTVILHFDNVPIGPKHIGVSGFYNII